MIQPRLLRRWRGPPLVLQILALLLGGLVVAQFVTLLLTIILPPAPNPQHSLAAVAAVLKGEAVPAEDRPDHLERAVQSGPPALDGTGWLVSAEPRAKLAAMLGAPIGDVRLAFYTPLPFAGTSGGTKLALLANDGPLRDDPAWRRDQDQGLLLLAQAPAPRGMPPGGAMRFPPGMPGGGGFGRDTMPPGTGARPGSGSGAAGQGRGWPQPSAPSARSAPDFPRDARPASPAGSESPVTGAEPPQAPQSAPGPAWGPDGLRPGPARGGLPGTRPFVPQSPQLPLIMQPQPAPEQTRSAPLPTPRAEPDSSVDDASPEAAVIPREPAPAPAPAPAVELGPQAPAGPAPAASDEAEAAAPEAPIPLPPRERGLFGIAPAPFVEGEFVAAYRLGDGRWAVVQPAPEPFPNAWQRRVLLWFLVAFAMVAPFGWLFARRVVKPLVGFAEAAEQLGRDPQSQPIDLDGPAEIGRAAHAFSLMQSRLKSFVDDRTAMVGAISHDLRTPLTRLRFRIEDVDDEAVREGMIAEVEEMEQMISSVLEFIRDASTANARERLDLRTIVEDVAENAAVVGADVAVEAASPTPVEVDVLGMRRLVANLVDNAVKYGARARIRLHVDRDEAVAEVIDAGPGLPAEDLERAFEPFYRSPQAQHSGKLGNGLGLAVCRSIARAHGGDVRLRRSPDGFTAELRVPLAFQDLSRAA